MGGEGGGIFLVSIIANYGIDSITLNEVVDVIAQLFYSI